MAYKLRTFTQRVRGLVLKRGMDIVEQNKLKEIEHDETHAHYHVENQRGGYYRVEVRLKEDNVTFTHCECPYRGIGLCKHTAAVLLDLLKKDGFKFEDLLAKDFVFEDSDVLEENGYEDALRAIIKEISQDPDFNLVQFLGNQDQADLMAFIMKYLEESEDIRLVVMAYLWYKNSLAKSHPSFLS